MEPNTPLCGVRHPMPVHADLTCELPKGHEGEHRSRSYDGFRLRWADPIKFTSPEEPK